MSQKCQLSEIKEWNCLKIEGERVKAQWWLGAGLPNKEWDLEKGCKGKKGEL